MIKFSTLILRNLNYDVGDISHISVFMYLAALNSVPKQLEHTLPPSAGESQPLLHVKKSKVCSSSENTY